MNAATARQLTRYKAWANEITFQTVLALPEGEALRPRPTRFGNMVHTLNHVYVIDEIFRAHLEGRPHAYVARNSDHAPALDRLWADVRVLDCWYVTYAAAMTDAALDEVVEFRFVDGAAGAMTRGEILLHVVNHGTYHRGFVGDMLYQAQAAFPGNDLTVFLCGVDEASRKAP